MLPTKFGVNWHFGSGEEAKNRLSRWQPWRPFWISDQNYLSCFDLLVNPILPIKFQDNRPFVSGEEVKKIDFSDGNHGGHLRFPIGTILAIFLFTRHPDASFEVSCQLAIHFRRRS